MRRVVVSLLASALVTIAVGRGVVAAAADSGFAQATAAAVDCGTERWDVKTLADSDASDIDFDARRTTVRHLRKIDRPEVGSDNPRIDPIEFRTYRVRAKLKLAKLEDDSDYHLVIAQVGAPKKTMIVEFPHPGCTKDSIKRKLML